MPIKWFPSVPGGAASSAFPDWSESQIRQAMFTPGATLPGVLGFAPASIGVPTATNPSGTTASSSLYRLTYSATIGSTIGTNLATAAYWGGNAAGLGGFTVEWIWGHVAARKATGRWAMGLFTGVTAVTLAGDPSAFTDCLFFGEDTADANLQFMHNDGAAGCTKVNLGAGFAKTQTNRVYKSRITCAPFAGTFDWSITDLVGGATASGTAVTNIPANTVFMSPQFAVGGGTIAGNNTGFWTRCLAGSPY